MSDDAERRRVLEAYRIARAAAFAEIADDVREVMTSGNAVTKQVKEAERIVRRLHAQGRVSDDAINILIDLLARPTLFKVHFDTFESSPRDETSEADVSNGGGDDDEDSDDMVSDQEEEAEEAAAAPVAKATKKRGAPTTKQPRAKRQCSPEADRFAEALFPSDDKKSTRYRLYARQIFLGTHNFSCHLPPVDESFADAFFGMLNGSNPTDFLRSKDADMHKKRWKDSGHGTAVLLQMWEKGEDALANIIASACE